MRILRIQNKPVKIILRILITLIVILVILALAAFAFLYLYTPDNLAEMYEYDTIKRSDVSQQVLTTGHIRPFDTLPIFVDTAQKVGKVHVKLGDTVEAGQTIITYDVAKERNDLQRKIESARLNIENARLNLQSISLPAEGNELLQYNSDVTTAEFNVQQAQNNIKNLDKKIEQQLKALETAQEDVDRNQFLYDAGELPKVQYDASITVLENAQLALEDLQITQESGQDTLETRQTQLQDAQQKLSNAQDKMSDEANTIKYRQQEISIQLIEQQIAQYEADMALFTDESVSPAGGIVTSVNISDGGIASRGATLIEIDVTESIIAEADVTEYDVPNLKVGMESDITSGGLPDKIYKAQISKIAAEAQEKEKSSDDEVIVPVQFTLTAPDENLKIGYTVDIAVYTAKQEDVLALPIQSVLLEDEGEFVYVFDGETLTKTQISTGFYGDSSVEIVYGLSTGDRYVINPLSVNIPKENWFTTARDWLYNTLMLYTPDYALTKIKELKS